MVMLFTIRRVLYRRMKEQMSLALGKLWDDTPQECRAFLTPQHLCESTFTLKRSTLSGLFSIYGPV